MDHVHPHTHDHPHPHGHDDDHEHPAPSAAESSPRDGPVLLDIGGDIGAVIVRLDDDLEGSELPILALDDPDWDVSTHTGVWRRTVGGGSMVVAVYPELRHGNYQIVAPQQTAAMFEVIGGRVTQLDLRTCR